MISGVNLFDARKLLSKEDFDDLLRLIELARITALPMKHYNRLIELWELVETNEIPQKGDCD